MQKLWNKADTIVSGVYNIVYVANAKETKG
jgi:hypothetical protein